MNGFRSFWERSGISKKKSRLAKPGNFAAVCEADARDGVLGGIPTTAIAGLFPLFTTEEKL
jgi:hypothetical protein